MSTKWSQEDEIDRLLEQQGLGLSELSVEMAERLGLDTEVLSQKKVICQRCHKASSLWTCDGWTDEPMYTLSGGV